MGVSDDKESGWAPQSGYTWEDYIRRTKNDAPSPLLLRALPHLRAKTRALDLGCGALKDSRHLFSLEFGKVTALDANSPPGELLPENSGRFEFVKSTFEDFAFPTAEFDLINAQFVLPFIRPQNFARVFDSVLRALRTEGVFAGQFFGKEDTWAADPEMSLHDASEAKALLRRGADLLYFCEEQIWGGTTAMGESKDWHILHFIARRRAP